MTTPVEITSIRREARIYSRDEHTISRRFISQAALKVLYRLDGAGFRACLVGGGVRDLLLGREPKDFDIATDAQPEQVRELFKNSRLIGRRFRLAHVRFGREIIEVATFRAPHIPDDGEALTNDEGRILRDNVYGNLDDDVWRRDFTVNALYYDIHDFSVIDYTQGLDDLKRGVMRLIGDPEQRYREDPVRMLRAVRFSVKLGFSIESNTAAPIARLGHLLEKIAPARLFDEMLKLFHGGTALQTYEALRHHGLFAYLFPLTEYALSHQEGGFPATLVQRALANTDARVNAGKSVTPAFLVAALLWDAAEEQRQLNLASGMSEQDSRDFAADTVISKQVARVAFPRRFTQMTREIWALQQRLIRLTPKRAVRVFEHPRFRAAYDFLVLRAEAGEPIGDAAEWWTRYQEVDEAGQQTMLGELKPGAGRARRRRRRGPSTKS